MASSVWESACVGLLVALCFAQNLSLIFLGFCVMRAEAAAKRSELALARDLARGDRRIRNRRATTLPASHDTTAFMRLCARYFGHFLLGLADGASMEQALERASPFQPEPHSATTRDTGRPLASPLRLR